MIRRQKEWGENIDKRLHCGFCRKEWAGKVSSLGLTGLNHFSRISAVRVVPSCLVPVCGVILGQKRYWIGVWELDKGCGWDYRVCICWCVHRQVVYYLEELITSGSSLSKISKAPRCQSIKKHRKWKWKWLLHPWCPSPTFSFPPPSSPSRNNLVSVSAHWPQGNSISLHLAGTLPTPLHYRIT